MVLLVIYLLIQPEQNETPAVDLSCRLLLYDNGSPKHVDGSEKLSIQSRIITFGYIPVLRFCPLTHDSHFNYQEKNARPNLAQRATFY
ncbi:hypothetical protein GJU40_12645 [Bacillus lacus]|uniref:Uncharacterized protein n=1 Tax=Metabacillus lacus TaxID=1983721 RepID=A0A7X2J0G0_9BACI|nr:hypothetical protein [Metabacillus lacus]MRX72989.1 hypothetical protein [Metabacillus lacus]